MTRSRNPTTVAKYFSGALAALVLAGCAGMQTGGTPEQVVRKRAAERAEAFVKGDMPRSYAFTTPSFRKLRDEAAYARAFGGGVKWQKAEVRLVTCEAQRCVVQMAVTANPLIPKMIGDTITVQFEETWLQEDGNWWLHPAL